MTRNAAQSNIRKWGVRTSLALGVTIAAVLGLASPAFATHKEGGYFSIPPYMYSVETYNYAAGHVWHSQTVGGMEFFEDFGQSCTPATRTWAYGFRYVDHWKVVGTVQENDKSGVRYT